MPVIKPGGGESGGKLATEKQKVDYTFIVPKGSIVKIEYED